MYQWMINVLLALLIASPLYATEYIVKYKDQKSFFSNKTVQSLNVLDQHEVGKLVKVKIEKKDEAKQVINLLKNPNVEYVVENFQLHRFDQNTKAPALREQWANSKVDLAKAWSLATHRGSKKVVVGVIDTGVDYRHESLSTNMIPGYDFKDKDDDPMDELGDSSNPLQPGNPGHGTHCSGSIAGNGNVENGIIGASPVVSIMPLRFLGKNGGGDLMDGIKAIDYAIDKNVDILSNSWGATISASQAQPLIEAVKRANDAGIIFIAAAANDGKNNDQVSVYPANAIYENTISVAASNPSDGKPQWSNYGRKNVHIASPGENIMSTVPNNKYQNMSGTSMATPLVAGVVALLKAQQSDLTGAEAKALIQVTGAKVDIETACNCRIDAGSAMEKLVKQEMFTVPAAGSIGVNESLQFATKFGQAPFTFSSSDPAIATIDNSGLLKGVAQGNVKVTVTDSTGATAESLEIYVGATQSSPPGGGDCPLNNPMLCEGACQLFPDLPFCTKVN